MHPPVGIPFRPQRLDSSSASAHFRTLALLWLFPVGRADRLRRSPRFGRIVTGPSSRGYGLRSAHTGEDSRERYGANSVAAPLQTVDCRWPAQNRACPHRRWRFQSPPHGSGACVLPSRAPALVTEAAQKIRRELTLPDLRRSAAASGSGRVFLVGRHSGSAGLWADGDLAGN